MTSYTDGKRAKEVGFEGCCQRRLGTRGAAAVLAFALLASWAGTAKAQTRPSKKLPSMATKVHEVSKDVQTLHLYVNRSAMVESNIPVSRVQSFAPEIASVESIAPNQVLLTGKALGTTHVLLVAPDGQQQMIEVVVAVEMKRLREALGRLAPGNQVTPQVVGNSVILTGVVTDSETADHLMHAAASFAGDVQNHLRVAGEQQVLLRTTVAEVSKNAIRQLGVNGWFGGDHFDNFFMVNQIDQINPINIGAAANQNIVDQLVFLTGQDGIPIASATTLSLGFPRVEMQLFMAALRQNGLLRVLAEPNLVAISGQTASFLAGGEFPYPVPQSSGAGTTITIEWKEFGVMLNFTPAVLGNEMIRLQVSPEVSELDFTSGTSIAGTAVPGISQRRAETTVELASGQTLAIAGLLSSSAAGASRRIPALGDVPVLGAMFSSNEYRQETTDLVIMVTPEIVSPLNPDQVPPVPGEYMTHPNDWQFYALGLLEGEPAGHPYEPVWALKTDIPVRTTPSTAAVLQDQNESSMRGPWGPADREETQ